MNPPLHALPQTGPRRSHALPVAGSTTCWFDSVETWGGARTDSVQSLDPEARARLSAPRSPLLGLDLSRPRIMGILNVTPDSFSDGGDHTTVQIARDRARAMAQDADILDVGGESTRPGADDVPVAEEISRVVPVIEAIRGSGIDTPISIDTRKSAVAEAALAAGADMVNDVSALSFDPEMADLVAERAVPLCLMHAQGDPKTMQSSPRYDDVVGEVFAYLGAALERAEAAGIPKEAIIADPGIGFGKSVAHNLSILRSVSVYHDLGVPLLLGVSRKRFIGTIGKADAAKERMPGSVAVALHGVSQGVQLVRVHDVAEMRQALRLWMALNGDEWDA